MQPNYYMMWQDFKNEIIGIREKGITELDLDDIEGIMEELELDHRD
jgi:hypothetical protein